MKLRILAAVALTLGMTAGSVQAGEHHPMPTGPGSAEFERIKTLAGRWEGTSQESGGEAQPAAAEYKVTSGGSVVVETLFPGTPHEMVSVYHDQNGKLVMTHYCMLRNQPVLELNRQDAQMVELTNQGAGLRAPGEIHMHALTMAWDGPDKITQVWRSQEGSESKGGVTIMLSRVR